MERKWVKEIGKPGEGKSGEAPMDEDVPASPENQIWKT